MTAVISQTALLHLHIEHPIEQMSITLFIFPGTNNRLTTEDIQYLPKTCINPPWNPIKCMINIKTKSNDIAEGSLCLLKTSVTIGVNAIHMYIDFK